MALATENDFRYARKHVGMSNSTTHAMRNEATQHWKPPKVTPVTELAIGAAIATSYGPDGCGPLRMVADGCEHERSVERTHPQPPDHQNETGTLATHSEIKLPHHRP